MEGEPIASSRLSLGCSKRQGSCSKQRWQPVPAFHRTNAAQFAGDPVMLVSYSAPREASHSRCNDRRQ
jgi:hypothetical protein